MAVTEGEWPTRPFPAFVGVRLTGAAERADAALVSAYAAAMALMEQPERRPLPVRRTRGVLGAIILRCCELRAIVVVRLKYFSVAFSGSDKGVARVSQSRKA